MISIPGYHLQDQLGRTNFSVVYRGCKADGIGESVIIKLLNSEYPDLEQLARLKREYALLSKIDSPNVIKALELVKHGRKIAIIIEDVSAISLNEVDLKGGLDLRTFFSLSLAVTNGLSDIHARRILHKDICPANIVWNRAANTVKVIDLNLSQELLPGTNAIPVTRRMAGTLAYASPEQTGRMNRSIDMRSDLYSLGITLYELLCGRLPFEFRDAIELVHAHIARAPTPLQHHRPDLPPTICKIIMRLLKKKAEDRYHTAAGLRADILQCFHSFERTGSVEDFEICANDTSHLFRIPDSLFGRDEDSAFLRRCYDRVANESLCELVVVNGAAGIGKSALAGELCSHVLKRDGYFIGGEFDEANINVPYSGFIQAFSELALQLLSSNAEKLRQWRTKLTTVLGGNARVVTEVIPDLVRVIGHPPEIPDLGGAEAQNRFNFTFLSFVRALTSPEHPLVIFLDDLHWMDDGSRRLLELIMTDPQMEHLLIIGTYRDADVGQWHPLREFLDALVLGKRKVHSITLPPLNEDDVHGLLTRTFDQVSMDRRPLAKLSQAKTGGNPFFLTQFLRSLFEDGLITFNSTTNSWEWDLGGIRQKDVTDNMVELMSASILVLPDRTKELLKIASCTGRVFDAGMLSRLSHSPVLEVIENLHAAVHEGFLVPVSQAVPKKVSGEWLVGSLEDNTTHSRAYQFVHDRTRAACISLMTSQDKSALHLKLGRHLLPKAESNSNDADLVFVTVGHLNKAQPLIVEPRDREVSYSYNLQAAILARRSMATETALEYLKKAMSFLPEDRWESRYEDALKVYTEAVRSAQLNHDLEGMNVYAEEVLKNSRNVIDQMPIYETRGAYYMARRMLPQAVDTCLEALALLKIRLPRKPNTFHIVMAIMKARFRLYRVGIDGLKQLPPMSDPAAIAIMRLIKATGTAAYLTEPNLIPLLAAVSMEQTLKHGACTDAVVGLCGFGFVLMGPLGKPVQGYQIADWSRRIPAELGTSAGEAPGQIMYNMMVHHWMHPLKDSLEAVAALPDQALAQGESYWMITGRHLNAVQQVWAQQDLALAEQAMDENIPVMVQHNQEWFVKVQTFLRYCVYQLRGHEDPQGPPSLRDFDLSDFMAANREAKDEGTIAIGNLMLAMVSYIGGDFGKALEYSTEADKLRHAVVCSMFEVTYVMYFGLALLARAQRSGSTGGPLVRKAKAQIKRMRGWSEHCPQNFLHKQLLMEAELERTLGNDSLALQKYQKALKLAGENEFPCDEALCAERLCDYFASRGLLRAAESYLWEAYYCYQSWGADAKAASLEDHPQLRLRRQDASMKTSSSPRSASVSSSGSRDSFGDLDLDSIMKSTRAISGEIILDNLIRKMLHIVIENAGAQRGVLVLKKAGGLFVEAVYNTGDKDVLLESIPLAMANDKSPLLCTEIANFVFNTGRTVVLDDARRQGNYVQAAYVQEQHAKSIICQPLVHLGTTAGVIYLENNRTSHAFPSDRVEVLEILCSQMAVSMENAIQFKHNEDLMKSFERFVPAEFLNLLKKDSVLEIQLGDGIEREMTVLFSDIRSFTTLVESLTAKEAIKFINEYLKAMETPIMSSGGFICQYVGDAIMALFAVEPQRAVEAAVQMTRALAEYNEDRSKNGRAPIRVGIGLHTGTLMLGTIGSPKRLECSVISDTVNTAARLETMTKQFGAALLISDYLRSQLDSPEAFTTRIVGKMLVKGKRKPVTVYEVLEAEEQHRQEAKVETAPLFAEAISHYWSGDFSAAKVQFEQCLKEVPFDLAAEAYIKNCEALILNPPKGDWDGILRLRSK